MVPHVNEDNIQERKIAFRKMKPVKLLYQTIWLFYKPTLSPYNDLGAAMEVTVCQDQVALVACYSSYL